MNIKKSMSSLLLAALTMVSFQASAGYVSLNQARNAANNFIKQHASSQLNAPSMSDLKLAHAEASKVVEGANDYYAFNVKGGGFVIIAGEDRAPQVLGYSDKGQLDFNRLPYGLQGLLCGYKQEIEFLLNYEEDDLVTLPQSSSTKEVGPLIQTTWGQEDPYDWQCPMKNGEYCVVGCVATAMAQVMYYWKFPEGSNAIAGYTAGWWWWDDDALTVEALPATTFNYNLMLLSYCHWNYNTSTLVQDTYTDAQAQEVAKLSRYCGQAVEMDYDPEGSGAYTWDQLQAMKDFGYKSTAQDITKSGYSTTQWEAKMKTELDAGRPILYSANDPNEGGHAFICDGYNSSNYFHFNLGWYGTCDGWYLSTALQMVHRSGDVLNFSSSHEMLIGVEPPDGWTPPVTVIRGDVDGNEVVNMDDLSALINYLLDSTYPINEANADCDNANGVNMDDLSELINYLLTNQW